MRGCVAAAMALTRGIAGSSRPQSAFRNQLFLSTRIAHRSNEGHRDLPDAGSASRSFS